MATRSAKGIRMQLQGRIVYKTVDVLFRTFQSDGKITSGELVEHILV